MSQRYGWQKHYFSEDDIFTSRPFTERQFADLLKQALWAGKGSRESLAFVLNRYKRWRGLSEQERRFPEIPVSKSIPEGDFPAIAWPDCGRRRSRLYVLNDLPSSPKLLSVLRSTISSPRGGYVLLWRSGQPRLVFRSEQRLLASENQRPVKEMSLFEYLIQDGHTENDAFCLIQELRNCCVTVFCKEQRPTRVQGRSPQNKAA